MVKKIIIICSVLAVGILVFVSCRSYKKDINDNGRKWMESFINKDADEIYETFSKDVKENRSELTKEEIQKALKFIDGNVVESEYEGYGGEDQRKEDYKTYYYHCIVRFNLYTDNNKCYHVDIGYDYINDDEPEMLGVNYIRINRYEEGDSHYYKRGEEITIGTN